MLYILHLIARLLGSGVGIVVIIVFFFRFFIVFFFFLILILSLMRLSSLGCSIGMVLADVVLNLLEIFSLAASVSFEKVSEFISTVASFQIVISEHTFEDFNIVICKFILPLFENLISSSKVSSSDEHVCCNCWIPLLKGFEKW